MQSFVLKRDLGGGGGVLLRQIAQKSHVPKILKGCEVKTNLLAIKSQNIPVIFCTASYISYHGFLFFSWTMSVM